MRYPNIFGTFPTVATRTPTQPLSPVRHRVLELRKSGLYGTDIAKVLGITHQRVYQHLKALRAAGLLEEKSA